MSPTQKKTIALAFLLLLQGTAAAAAGVFELSASASFGMSYYGPDYYTWTRHWGASFGYYVGTQSEIEVSFQDVTNRAKTGSQDTTFHDQVYSIQWVQTLVPKTFFIQPFAKLGIGQLNREANGSYANGAVPPLIYDSLTGVVGAGFRIYIYGPTALRMDATTYLADGQLSTWQDNFNVTTGISIYF